jgi:hypothetical protein
MDNVQKPNICINVPSSQTFRSYLYVSRDSGVGIATSYWLDDEESQFESRWGQDFHFSMSSRPALGSTQPPIQWVPGSLSPGVKWPGREADHSLPASTEVKKTCVYIPTTLYVFMPQCLIS